MLVKQLVGRKDRNGDVGLELEIESTKPLPLDTPAPWIVKRDGSLRGPISLEYYTDGPIKVNPGKLDKITRLTDILNAPASGVIKDSPRTSFHVHVNVLNFQPREMWAAAAAYWLLEPLLMEFCGTTRVGNMFCLRLKDAEAIIPYAIKDVLSKVPFDALRSDRLRYAGLNLNAVYKFGTLEFRGMRGTTDPVLMDNWSTALHYLVNAAKELGSPSAVLDYYLDNGFLQFMVNFVHKSIRGEIASIKYGKTQMDEALLILGELAYAVDWDSWQTNINNTCKPMRARRTLEDEAEEGIPLAFNRRIVGDIPQARVGWANFDIDQDEDGR